MRVDKIFFISIVISSILHGIILFKFPYNKYLKNIKKNSNKILQNEINVILPEYEEIANKNKLNKNKLDKKIKKGYKTITGGNGNEDKTVLNYQNVIKKRLQSVKKYPEMAKKERIEGLVIVEFTILRNGKVKNIKVVKSSGKKVLDEAAIYAVKRGEPYPPFPEELNLYSLLIDVKMFYKLK